MTASATAGSISPLFQGFVLCASLIIALGPQNLFILRQALRRQRLFVVAIFSTLADLFLILLGVGGLSALISNSSIIHTLVTSAGVLFLLWCGSRALLNALRPCSSAQENLTDAAPHAGVTSLQVTILTTLSFAFLNPYKYLDTLMIIGSKSLAFPDENRFIFGIGAVLASTLWFFLLAYGASKISRLFHSPAAWRTLDMVSGCVMIAVALSVVAAPHVTA